MNELIHPHLFDGVRAFFTGKALGTEVEKISSIFHIAKENIFFPVQRHSDTIFILESDMRPRIADAVITARRGILIGVKVADCVPILLLDEKRSVIGAVHAGWRGSAAGIVKKSILLMIDRYESCPEDILVAIGPGIKCYEVGSEVKEAVEKTTGEGEYYCRSEQNGKFFLDLSHANMLQVVSLGVPVQNIWISGECTYCNSEKYYSYRYMKTYNGSQGGFIGIF
ncbi:MAG: peptidoglycan editing factor PgeF [Nitrospirota bacterium]